MATGLATVWLSVEVKLKLEKIYPLAVHEAGHGFGHPGEDERSRGEAEGQGLELVSHALHAEA